MTPQPTDRIAAPEWVTGLRDDRAVIESHRDGWSVSNGPLTRGFSSTDFASHTMTVPAGDSPLAEAVRAHELIHAAVSPHFVPGDLLRLWGVSNQSIALAEELRVNALLRHDENMTTKDGVPLWQELKDGSEKKSAEIAVEKNDYAQAVMVFAGTFFTGAALGVKRRLRTKEEWRRPLERIQRRIEGVLGKDGCYVHGYSRMSTEPIEIEYPDPKGHVRSAVLPYGFIYGTLPLALMIEEAIASGRQSGPGDGEVTAEPGNNPGDGLSDHWDSIRFGMTKLTEPTARFFGKRRRPAITGKIPRRPDRLLTDPERRVFSEEVRGQGGVVVFDCSGSMSIQHHHVTSILSAFSGATIVAYANHYSGHPNAWILAKNGRMVTEAEFRKLPLHGGNGIDAPIVAWAARQKKTHKDFLIWISDGEVTGKNDHQTDELFDDMAAVIRRHGVTNVRHEHEAVTLVRNIKLGRPVPRAYSEHRKIRRRLTR